MDEQLLTNLRMIYKPIVTYYGEWTLGTSLMDIAELKKGKNLYKEFLERYYYTPLNVIFNNDEIVYNFEVSICSKFGPKGRSLFFSKRSFLRNIVTNIDELIDNNGEEAYKAIKKAIRIKKDIYRDVYNNGEESKYYNQVMNEFLKYSNQDSFEDFVKLCKKQYTRLLNGYNSVMDLFDKPINIDKFIGCFDINKLYLFTCYKLVKHNYNYYDKYNNLDYTISFVDEYRKIINDLRQKEPFYNSVINVVKDNEIVVYTIDDLFRDLSDLEMRTK